MTTKLKLVNKLVEILPQDDTTTYPRLNFNLSNGTYAVPASATDPHDGNTAASCHFGNYIFYIPTYAFKTITLAGTTNQTITLKYTEPGASQVTQTSTSSNQVFTVKYGTTWTATAEGATGYNAGALNPGSSGTVTAATTISAGTATAMTTITLTDSKYKMSDVYPDTYNKSSMKVIPNILNTSSLTTAYQMFKHCYYLKKISQSSLDTSNVTNMCEMFHNCIYSLTSIPQLNTSKVTNMESMFATCEKLTSIPQLNTSNVTNMRYMFDRCVSLSTIPQLDTNNVTRMTSMFSGCSKLPATFPWTINCSSITDAENMKNMFRWSPVTKVTLKNVKSSIRSNVTSQLLKNDDTLTINFV